MLRRHLFEAELARRGGSGSQPEQQEQQQAGRSSLSMSGLVDSVGLGSPDLVAAASACYWVAYSRHGDDGDAGQHHPLMPLLGLPWTVAGDVLGQYRAMLVGG